MQRQGYQGTLIKNNAALLLVIVFLKGKKTCVFSKTQKDNSEPVLCISRPKIIQLTSAALAVSERWFQRLEVSRLAARIDVRQAHV
jgi:hypothetical protein